MSACFRLADEPDIKMAESDDPVDSRALCTGKPNAYVGRMSLSATDPHKGATKMSETLPDRLSIDPSSPFYDAALLERGVGVRFKGAEKTNVEEYCVSEGWIRDPAPEPGAGSGAASMGPSYPPPLP